MKFKKLKTLDVLLFVAVIVFALAVTFYQFGKIPFGMNTDETAIGYNAYSILKTGQDEYGRHMPLYFKSFGDNKLPVYIYSTAGMIALLGPTPVAVRLTSAIFGIIAIVALYFLIRFVFGNKWWALTGAFLLAINPWHIFFSRTGYEVNVATTLLLLGTLFFFLWDLGKKHRLVYIFLSVIFFILSAYCYNATRVLAPTLFFSLMAYFKWSNKKASFKRVIFPVILFLIGMIPFVISFLTHSITEAQGSLLINGGQSRANVLEFRSYLSVRPHVIASLFFNSAALYAWQFLKNIVSYFSVPFFFVAGPNHPINGVMNFGMFHLFEVVSIPLGIFMGIKNKIGNLIPIYIWTILVVVFSSITSEVPHPTRSYALLFPFIIFSSYGFVLIVSYIRSLKYIWIKRIAFAGIAAVIAYSVSLYLLTYFLYFPTKYAQDWRSQDQELALFIKSIEKNYDHIIIEDNSNFAYTSYLFYSQYPPEELHKTEEYGQNGLLTTLKKFGKFEYRKLDDEQDKHKPNMLIISPHDKILDVHELREFKLPTQKQVMFYDNKFVEIPTVDTVYKVYSTR